MSIVKLETLSKLDGSADISTDTVYRGVAKAHVTFNMVGASLIRSFNVTSITDSGTGQATINFTTAIPEGGLAVESDNSDSIAALAVPRASLYLATVSDAGAYQEPSRVYVAVYR